MNRRAYLSTFGATALILTLTLLTSVLIARSIGPEGRGLLLAITIWPGLLIGILGLGLNEGTVYHMARSSGSMDGAAGSYADSGLVLQLAVVLIATPLTLLLLPSLLRGDYGTWIGVVLTFATLYSPLVILDQHFKAVLQGSGKYGALNAVRLGPPLVYAALLVAFLIAERLTVETVLVAMIASFVVTAVTGASLAGVSVRSASRQAMRDTMVTGTRFHMGNVLTYVSNEADKLIVLVLVDVASVGYYAVAVALSPLGATAVVQSLGIILSREMARAATANDSADVFAGNFLTATLMLLAINGAAAALAPWWMPALYGTAFSDAVPILAILLVVGAVKGLRQITDRAMRGLHTASVGAVGEAVALVLTLVFAYAGARMGGLEGLAWGLVLAQSIALAVMLMLAVRVLGIGVSDLARRVLFYASRLPVLAWREARLLKERIW
jgi:O-antigen/teichoic acid export membrane protein